MVSSINIWCELYTYTPQTMSLQKPNELLEQQSPFYVFACLRKFMFCLAVSILLTFEGYKTCYGTLLSDLSDINKVLNK